MTQYCLIVAVLMIYSHSTNASKFIGSWDDAFPLKKDAPLVGSRFIGRMVSEQIYGKRTDIVCDVLDHEEKQSLCDEMMAHQHLHQAKSYFDTNTRHPVPHLADSSDPYRCVRIPIRNHGFSKRMYWCRPRKFVEIGSGATGERRGFFLGGSPYQKDTVFSFEVSEKNRKRVEPLGMMYEIKLLMNKGPAFERNSSRGTNQELSPSAMASSTRPSFSKRSSSSGYSSEDSTEDSSKDSSESE